ncbi:filamentous hemagglutinin N-terminal domain-containing protein [Salmonella enterica]|nr:filamentous hemagglutinin N-terminal domain-containing protein [Salmonella enterica]
MNKIYKLKYDRRRNQLVAVSELTAGAGKEATGSVAGLCGLQGVSTFRRLMGTLTPLAVLTGLVIGMLPGLALANPELPTGGQVVAGQGSISTSGNQMTIQQHTHGLVTSWNSFDIGKNHTVQFVQPDSSAVALNRVTGGHESQILGTLNANGQVMLVNPAGVMFGKGAKVNTAGLVASTKNIRTEDFMAGRYTFSGGSHPGAEVVNQGSLTTTKGGYIVLAADRVRNSGTITTPSGKTVLAAAEKVTLQLDNTGLASVSVNGSVVNALVENRGLIAATNGQVYLTARGKDMLLNTVVNNSGTVEARGLNQQGGNIVLDGGDSGVVSQSGMLLADSDTGRGGKITVQGKNIHLAADSRTSATGQAGGEVYVGGGWQGNDSRIKNASKVVTDKTSVVDVSATGKGDGGTAVLWSDDYTNFRGSILAKGGAESGKGGRVETSSRGTLLAAGDVQAGKGGEWLLDPTDISITGATDNTGILATGEGTESKLDTDTAHVFSPNAVSGSVVAVGKITGQLNSGTNVTIKTTGVKGGDGTQGGNITVNADIGVTGNHDVALTLEADKNITVNKNITSTAGKLNVNLLGAGSSDGKADIFANISTNGGDVLIGRTTTGKEADRAFMVNITSGGGKYGNITAGNITIEGKTKSNGDQDFAVIVRDNAKLAATGAINITGAGFQSKQGVYIHEGVNLTATGDIQLNGTAATSHGVRLYNSSLSSAAGNITLSGVSAGRSDRDGAGGVMIVASNITADVGNITVSGTDSVGASGILLNGMNISAGSGNITMEARGFDSNAGALQVKGNNNFTAQNTVLSGEAGRNNVGTLLGGNLNVTQGNLSVTGTSHHYSSGGFRGLKADKLNLNVSSGTLSLTGKSVAYEGRGAQSGAVAGLELINTSLSASSATLMGSSVDSGSGFILNNVTLNDGIENGANLTLSSAGSGVGVINIIGNMGRNGFVKSLVEDHPDGLGSVTEIQDATVFKNDLESSQNDDLVKDYGNWQLDFSGLNLDKKGNISIKGASFTNSNLTAGMDLSLETSTGSLLLSGTELNATQGNITLNSGGTGPLNLSGATLNASGAGGINLTTKTGLIIDNSKLTAANGAVTVKNSDDSINSMFALNGVSNITATDINISNNNGKLWIGVAGGSCITLNATAGNVSLRGNENNKNQVSAGGERETTYLSAVNVTAKDSLNIFGASWIRSGWKIGVSITQSANLTAGNFIGITGDSLNDYSRSGVLFSGKAVAGNISIKGRSGSVNAPWNGLSPGVMISAGAQLAATSGDLSIDGAGNLHQGVYVEPVSKDKTAETLSAVNGSINISGFTEYGGKGVELYNAVLNASHASVTGKGYYQTGGGFLINGTKFEGGIAEGANLSFMSTGTQSASNVIIDTDISFDNLKSIAEQGIQNNTQVIFTSSDDLLRVLNNKNKNSWDVDASAATGAHNNKPGVFEMVLQNADVTVSGDINATGVTFQNSNLTASRLNLNGAPGTALKVTNSNLTATGGDVSLSGDAVKLSGKNVKGVNSNTINASNGSVIITAKGNITGNALDVSNISFKSKDGTTLTGTSTVNGNGVLLGGVINVTGGLDANGTSTRVNNASYVYGLRTGDATINVDGVMNLTGTVNGEPGAKANNQVVGLDLGSATLNASSANLTGVSTAKGFGFWMNSTLQGGLIENNNLNLRSSGSGDGVKNFIGQHVDSSVVKNMVESNKDGLGSITEVNDTTIFRQELENAQGDDLVKDYGNWQLDFSGVNLNKTGNISIKGASFRDSTLTAGKDLRLAGAAGKILALTNTVLTSSSGNISLSGDAIRLGGGIVGGVNKNKLTASQGSVTVVAAGNVAGNSLDVANTSFTSKNGTALDGTATLNGNGVNLAGNTCVSGTLNIDGQSKGKGTGLFMNSNLDVTGEVKIAGESVSGSGVTLNGVHNISTGGGRISGKSVSGVGVSDAGARNVVKITPKNGQPFTVSGESETGSGLVLSGTLTNTDTSDKPAEVMFSGRSQSGDGAVVKNLTLSGLLGVEGSSTTGNGVAVSGNIVGDSREKNVITGTSAQGDGLVTADGTKATRVTLIGRATNGVGIRVKGALKNDDSALDGQATGTGTGVVLAGPVSGGAVTGFSQKGAGVTAGEGIKLDNVAVLGNTVDGVGVEFNGKPDMTGGTTVKGYASGSGRAFRNVGDDDHDDWSDIPSLTPDASVPSLPPDVPVVPDVSHPASPGQDKENSREDAVLRELQEHILQAGESRESLYRPGSLRDVVRPSGYRNLERPVSVDICTDGECRKLNVGLQDRPVR